MQNSRLVTLSLAPPYLLTPIVRFHGIRAPCAFIRRAMRSQTGTMPGAAGASAGRVCLLQNSTTRQAVACPLHLPASPGQRDHAHW